MANAIGDTPTSSHLHTNQSDEALRRVQPATPDASTSALLTRIADRLSTVRPGGTITEPRRLILALRYATEQHGYGTPEAEAAEQELLRHLPPIAGLVQRDEYSARLRLLTAGVTL